jgi:hypothetical protein
MHPKRLDADFHTTRILYVYIILLLLCMFKSNVKRIIILLLIRLYISSTAAAALADSNNRFKRCYQRAACRYINIYIYIYIYFNNNIIALFTLVFSRIAKHRWYFSTADTVAAAIIRWGTPRDTVRLTTEKTVSFSSFYFAAATAHPRHARVLKSCI